MGKSQLSFYLDIHDLIYKMGLEMMSEIGEMMKRSDSVIDFLLMPGNLVQMIAYVKEHLTFFDIYLIHYGAIDEAEMWYHFSFFKAGFISVLSEWIRRGCPETPEKLTEIILRSLPAA